MISLKHNFVSPKSDSLDITLIQPSNWNEDHVLSMASARLVGRASVGTGAAEEIAISSNLTLGSGTLDLASSVSVTALAAASATVSGAISGASLSVSGDVDFTGTGAVKLPAGTTAQRPSGVSGDIRFNSTLTKFEGHTGASWEPISTLTQGTAQASTSGTAISFTGIPSWAKRITVLLSGVSLSGTANILIQLGTASGFETTGYASSAALAGTSVDGGSASSTAGMIVRAGLAAALQSGVVQLYNVSGNTWVASGSYSRTDAAFSGGMGGTKTLADVLTQIRVTSTATDTFDAGTINVMWE